MQESPNQQIDLQSVAQKPIRPCQLSKGERLAIAPFKERYRSEVLKEKRVAMVKTEIMVAYFNYLHTQAQGPKSDDELKQKTKVRLGQGFVQTAKLTEYICMQFLASWIANNWRRTVTSNVIGLNIKVRPIDVVWRTRKEECEVELKKILNVEELDTSAPEYFQQRMAAAKLVLDGLSVRDREKLEADVVKIREKGHEPEVQQQCVCPVNHLPEWV